MSKKTKMIKCEICKRITGPKESTGKFITYKKVQLSNHKVVKQIASEKTVCINCVGEK